MPDYSLEEIGAAMESLAKTFEAFKAENDAALAEVKKGSPDPITTEKVDRINDAVTSLDDEVKRLTGSAEEAARKAVEEAEAKAKADAEAMAERIDGLEKRLNRTSITGDPEADSHLAKYADQFWTDEAVRRNAGRHGIEVGDESALDRYVDNMKLYLRYGDTDPRVEKKELSVGVEADGGYWVTPEMSNQVITRVFESSPIRSIASVMTISTDAVEFPTDTNSGTSGGWVGEKAARTETATPQTGTQRIPVHEQYAAPEATQKLLDDAGIDVEGWLAGKIADILARTENTAFVTGDGAAKPRGFMDYASAATTGDDTTRAWGVLQYVATGSSGGFDTGTVDATAAPADELIDLVAALKPVYRTGARWVMNRATEAEVRKLKDTAGNYVIDRNFAGTIRDNPSGFTLLGFPITTAEDMADIAADSFSIAFGNFNVGYQIVDRQGIRTLRDVFTNKPFVIFYTTKRVGGDVVNFDAIKLLKFGTS